MTRAGEDRLFHYSDGDLHEEHVAEMVSGSADVSIHSPDLAAGIRDWPSLYHLSSMRPNLLRPLKIPPGSAVLEVGSGMGVLTRYLAEAGCHVTAIEGSSRRAEVTARRVRDFDVDVQCVNFLDFEAPRTFDFVVAVGVLEYAACYSGHEEPHVEFMARCRQFVKDDGFVVIASENRLGLKYLLGQREDHLGVPYVGVEDTYDQDGPRTFSVPELEALADAVGLNRRRILFPLPDYKLVKSVVDYERVPDQALDTIAQLTASSLAADHQIDRPLNVSLELAAAGIVTSNLGSALSPSHLLVASQEGDVNTVLDPSVFAWVFASNRPVEYRKETLLVRQDGEVRAVRVQAPSTPTSSDVRLHQILADESVVVGRSTWLAFVQEVNREGWCAGDVARVIAPYTQLLEASATDGLLDGSLVDATPFNCVQSAKGAILYDQEWVWFVPVRLSWVMLRGILFSWERLSSCAKPAPDAGISLYTLSETIVRAAGVAPPVDRAGFLEWLTEVQALASGRPAPVIRDWLERLFDAPPPVRESRLHMSATDRITL